MISPLIGLLLCQIRPMPSGPVVPVSMQDVTSIRRNIPSKSPAQVLFFVATDCPIANRMAPELSRIVRDFRGKGVDFLYVYIDPTQSPADIRKHLAQFKLGAPGIFDKRHELVALTGATVTPEAVVFRSGGTMAYRGRINDLFLEHGRTRKAARREDLRIALKEILAGKPVSVPQTAVLGCSIPSLD